MKSKGEKERCSHFNAEFQRIARRDKKAFLSDQCKEIEENNRMGKTGDLFKKSRDIKGTFYAKMGSIKDRNGRGLKEVGDTKKRWQEYTEKLYKKDLHDPDNHYGVITHTHLEPDILECEVAWTLRSITTNKASGGDGIPVESFQILKDGAVKVLPANLENSAVATGLENVSFHSNPKERQCPKMFILMNNCAHFTSSRVMLTILQARLQQYMNQEIPHIQVRFRKGRGTRDRMVNVCRIIEKAREFQKND